MSDSRIDETEYRYEKQTWPEIQEAIDQETLILVPTAATEDHGHHLPVDVDIELATTICEETAKQRDDVLVFPTATQGYLPHHMDMVGGVTIEWETLINYLIDIGVSLAHHGFDKIMYVNGHGSNHHLVEQVARQIIVQHPDTHAAMMSWWDIQEVKDAAAELRDAGPEGSSHGGELETSLYMHLHPERVDMDKAARDIGYPDNDVVYNYGLGGGKQTEDASQLNMMEWWTTFSETGTRGDATVATPEKGEAFLDAAVTGLDSVLDEFKEYPIREIEDKHAEPRTDDDYRAFRPR